MKLLDPGRGRDPRPHVTVCFGLHDFEPAAVEKIAGVSGPITITLGKTAVFTQNDFDVVYIAVQPDEALLALRKKLLALPNTQSFAEYQPHVTLAYVKKGEGEKFAGDATLSGRQATVHALTFSPPAAAPTVIPLGFAGEDHRALGALTPPEFIPGGSIEPQKSPGRRADEEPAPGGAERSPAR